MEHQGADRSRISPLQGKLNWEASVLEERVSSQTALLLIDVQVNMFHPASPVEGSVPLLERLHGLLQRARGTGAPVVLVRNTGRAGDPDEPGTSGWELHSELQPARGDVVLDKT